MAPKIEAVTESAHLGEAPHWDIPSQTLYYVDILGKNILRYDPATKKVTKASVAPKQVSFIIPVEGKKDHFVISLDNEVVVISWDGASDKFKVVETLAVLDKSKETPDNKLNDAKCDAAGRLWAGTLGISPEGIDKTQPIGSLYSFTGRTVTKQLSKIKISNGLAWDDKKKKFYYIDSLKGSIDQYDFDVIKGTLSKGQAWFTLKKHDIPGIPDGMTVDSDGNLWVAVFNGGRILKIDSKKPETLLETIVMPVPAVTSLAFGGKNFDELYATTGRYDPTLTGPEHGVTYRITGTGSKGLPAVNFKL